MKKIILLLVTLFTVNATAQQLAFSIVHFKAHENSQNDIAELYEKHYADVKFKSGGIFLERLWQGRENGNTHRFVWVWELGNGGIEGEEIKFKNDAFWAEMNNYVDTWGKHSSGRFLSWKDGDVSKFPFGHLWDITPKDPVAFKKAHDKIVKDASDIFKDRVVGFGTYDINRPNGASHWVVIAEKDTDGHLTMHHNLENNYAKEMKAYFENRGEVEYVHDFVVQVLKRYE
ncbi:hypothetical protein N9R69_01670 [Flavobacteriaceae bacterium]|jgi:hypothetical protein|nr:hypothetical protein [Flavobacteriaceae bacterium]MDA9676294.1 hypothetical protein [Flavobacteriaceae bacterium]|tara:strand:+ start:3486 stop:4175 length:690 start_codon:yes stop_codon:yes gene_type:complete